jgi:hypothetical protein
MIASGSIFLYISLESCLTLTFSTRVCPRFVPLNARPLAFLAMTCDLAASFQTVLQATEPKEKRREDLCKVSLAPHAIYVTRHSVPQVTIKVKVKLSLCSF